ncbi:uracil-DNA glycosylase [Psittacicella gerlachiana]|uniref:Uracil-DNA glycosylase n=1 Tax=Psittacicella gerlachiana TaxID=2028574 RepID=A0A3A1Y6U8_9GAMM|nr:uracil-DNA glycosylase [Psittacicella gerlachiana]RIY33972.1 uracil-DNA glycosylase [Psittacicella gerlachiana]
MAYKDNINLLSLEVQKLNASWYDLGNFLETSGLLSKIIDLYGIDSNTVRPLLPDLFNAFNLPLNKVKVVILGQDPYPSDHAHGFAFSSASKEQTPKSLQNMIKAIKIDLGQDYLPNIIGKGNLINWVKQGVFLLNTRLTVNVGNPLDPMHDIWQEFILQVFNRLQQRKNIVYLLWGKHAQQYAKFINPAENFIITTSHPSPLSAHRGFFEANCFLKTNEYLIQTGQNPINW